MGLISSSGYIIPVTTLSCLSKTPVAFWIPGIGLLQSELSCYAGNWG